MTVLPQSMDALHRLNDAVDGFLRSEKEFNLTDPATHMLVGGRFRTLGTRIGGWLSNTEIGSSSARTFSRRTV
ncbi:hypothetical protein ABZX92_19030, partial [Lentzea sp. NPDC006480]|uniref:hypothetical protein n=1 Tax=Lentzea sp. NPDC006480 TaxID=3157176 RepID=UPI0033A049C0